MAQVIFPPLEDWEPTRQTLHWYSRGLSAIPRTHAEPHPQWWHAGLLVVPDGLVTETVPLLDGRTLWLQMNLRGHTAAIFVGEGDASDKVKELSMAEGVTSSQFADTLISIAVDYGLSGPYEREKFENSDPRQFNPEAAENFLSALVNADRIFRNHSLKLQGDVSPVHFWPHNFDLSVEWFGTRVETYEGKDIPSQLNLGFYLGDLETAAYFYSNPWPFEGEFLLGKPLPPGASWHTSGWKGTILPYEELVGDKQAESRLSDYAQKVFDLCAPTLLAD